MVKNLVIVESPAKAKTIEGYLGKDYMVKSSYGHVRDLPKGDFAVDVENNFTPTYKISPDKEDVVKQLKKIAKEAEVVWLATDDDREGEAISWHLKESLDLKDQKIKRIVFREITKNAIMNAIQNPRIIDMDLVNAQQTRRILDRLVGFELSPVLWKKIRAGLSAGRVQSVAVRLIVEREREIEKFKPVSSYKVTAQFDLANGKILNAELKSKIPTEKEAKAFLEKCKGATFTIENLEKKPGKKTPAAPFTTSTLQQEASRKLGFSVAQTMTIAQKLYEAGKITYMRTDSTSLSAEAIVKATTEIKKAYGDEYVQNRKYKSKSQTAQEAHEAIRPTDFSAHQAGKDRNEQRLYELIWKRAIASQMSDAKLEKTIATVGISTTEEKLIAEGQVIKFDGFLKVYLESTDEEEESEENKKMLPPLKIGQVLDLAWLKAVERFTRPAPRFTEASLVKKLEEMGIGRPSTYAPTISTIVKRNYVVKESREGKERKYKEFIMAADEIVEKQNTEITGTEKSKLFPTDVGMVVNDFLVAHFENIIDYSFTASVEKALDEIAHGKKEWIKILDNFYHPFHKQVEVTEDIDRKDVNTGRELGKDPVSGEKIYVKLGKYGPYVQLGEGSEEEKPKFASLRKGQLIETITLEEALDLFKLPREVGIFEEKEMVVAIGKFGPYVRHDGKFYSLNREYDPFTVSGEEAIEVILAKRKADAERIIQTWEENPDVQVLNGRWGPYIKVGKRNIKFPKDKDPKTITLAECLELA
ncbi:MAG: type I DNA topoisomerase, partial [Bacteroidota bacterium]